MRSPERWIAVLRLVVGAWFAKGVVTKLGIVLAWGIVPVPAASARWVGTMPKLLAKYAADNPFPWYRAYLLDSVIPDASLYANLTAFGEVFVGISLVAGLLTAGAVVGMMLTLVYGLAVQHVSSGQLGFHVLLGALMLTFFFARRPELGSGSWLRRRYTTSPVIQWFT